LILNTSETNVLKEAMKDEKQRINHLQNSQHEALKKIIDNAPVAIWMGDKYEQTVYANSRFEELVGYTLDEMMGRKSFDFWAKDSIATVQNNNEVREHGQKSTYEGDLLSKSNEIIPVRLTGIPIPTGTVGMMLDLRELRKEALQRAQLQRLSDSKDSFLNIASHELRTPITSIL
jgi:PAS domain S-box-containing protein